MRHASYISRMQWGHGGSGISVREKRYFKTNKMSNEVFQGKTKTKTTYLDYIEAKGSMKTSRTFEKSKRMKHYESKLGHFLRSISFREVIDVECQETLCAIFRINTFLRSTYANCFTSIEEQACDSVTAQQELHDEA